MARADSPTSNGRRLARQRGVALLSAVLTVAVAGAVSTRLLGSMVDQQSRTALFMDSDQARLLAVAAEPVALNGLDLDRQAGDIDTLQESWASPASYPVEGGTVTGRLIDLQGRFNLNSLWDGTTFKAAAYQQLVQLFEAAGVSAQAASAVAEWESSEVPPVPGVSGDSPYLLLSPAYLRPRMPMASASELRLVEGVDGEGYRALEGSVAALPESVPINVNTASALVLRSLSPLIDDRGAAEIIKARDAAPFADLQAFRAVVENAVGVAAASQIPYDRLGVSSSYFMLEVEAQVGSGRAVLYSLIHRPKEEAPRVLMRSGTPL